MLIPIPLFWIIHINTTMHNYKIFTFWIVFCIPIISFILKPHSTLLKKKVVMFIWINFFRIIHVNTTMHDYTIDYYCYCLCIAGHNFYCFVYSIEHLREQRGKCICFSTEWNFHSILLIPYFQCTHLHTARQ